MSVVEEGDRVFFFYWTQSDVSRGYALRLDERHKVISLMHAIDKSKEINRTTLIRDVGIPYFKGPKSERNYFLEMSRWCRLVRRHASLKHWSGSNEPTSLDSQCIMCTACGHLPQYQEALRRTYVTLHVHGCSVCTSTWHTKCARSFDYDEDKYADHGFFLCPVGVSSSDA